MQKTAEEFLLAAKSVEVQAGAGAKTPTVSILAYTGGLMRVGGYGLICIDLAGLDLGGNRVAILSDHNSALDGVLGQGVAAVQGGQLTVQGEIVAANDAAKRVIELSKSGFQFQASVGCEPLDLQPVGAGRSVSVNGRAIQAPEGGFTLIAKARLREVSILALGADADTAVWIAAAKKGTGSMETAETERIRAQERAHGGDRSRVQGL